VAREGLTFGPRSIVKILKKNQHFSISQKWFVGLKQTALTICI